MHVLTRGTRGVNIVRDVADRTQFLRSLYYLNDIYANDNWKRDIAPLGMFERPSHWPEQEPLVNILAFTLMPNHFHLLLEERTESGIAKFMQRLCGSMSKSFNKKYREKGSLFQSSYKGKTVAQDTYLRQLVWYILVKNTLDLYPGGINAALTNFEEAWEWGLEYRFSSFGGSVTKTSSSVVADKEGLISNICLSSSFKKDAKGFLKMHKFRSEELKVLALEGW